MLESSGGREYLPLFECREQLCCRIWHVSVGTAPSHQYDIALWRRVSNDNPKLLVEHTSSGVEITTDPDQYSYCAQYGPFEAPADGVYEFLLEYAPIEGRFALTVMDESAAAWLPSTVVEIDGDGAQLLALSVDLPRGTKFSLFIVELSARRRRLALRPSPAPRIGADRRAAAQAAAIRSSGESSRRAVACPGC